MSDETVKLKGHSASDIDPLITSLNNYQKASEVPKIGEKEMLIFGFLFMIISTLAFPFIKIPILIMFALILFATRIGAATVEVMSESYFFKKVTKEDADEIAFFRNTLPVSFIIAPAFATLILLFVPNLSYLYFILGAILGLGLLLSLRLKDTN